MTLKELFHNIFLDTYKGNEYPGDILALHTHPYHEISLIKTGEITYVTNKSAKYISGKSLTFSPAYCYHNHYVSRSKYENIQLRLDSDFLYNFFPALAGWFSKIISNDMWSLTDEQYDTLEHDLIEVRQMLLLEKSQSVVYRQAISVLKLILDLAVVVSESQQMTPNDDNNIYINDIINYIDNYYYKKITLSELSKKFFVSRSKLINDFKKYTGVSLNDFILLSRIEFSKGFLSSGMTVAETAKKCGFSTSSHFINVFKKQLGVTPLAYSQKIHSIKEDL